MASLISKHVGADVHDGGYFGTVAGFVRIASLLFSVAAISIGFGTGALWLLDYPWGFMAIVGSMGMVGVAVNDSIVVSATIQEELEKSTDLVPLRERLIETTRHVLATTITTIVGFARWCSAEATFGRHWRWSFQLGVGGATFLALFFVPAAYLLLKRQRLTESSIRMIKPKHYNYCESPAMTQAHSTTHYDVIMIGSGMGALTTASILAQIGKKRVLLLERHFKPGGFTHSFRRKKYEWDVGSTMSARCNRARWLAE